MKDLPDGDSALWITVEIDLSAEHAIHMMAFDKVNDEFSNWHFDLKKKSDKFQNTGFFNSHFCI